MTCRTEAVFRRQRLRERLNAARIVRSPLPDIRETTRSGGKASDCIACGQCEAACPQHIHIIDELKKAAEMLEV